MVAMSKSGQDMDRTELKRIVGQGMALYKDEDPRGSMSPCPRKKGVAYERILCFRHDGQG